VQSLPQRLELDGSPREGAELLLGVVDRRRARPASCDAQCVNRPLLDVGRLGLFELEVATERVGRLGTDEHVPRPGGRLQACSEHGRVPEGRVIHPQVVADGAHDDRARVDANA
jgi:hypothetical protein